MTRRPGEARNTGVDAGRRSHGPASSGSTRPTDPGGSAPEPRDRGLLSPAPALRRLAAFGLDQIPVLVYLAGLLVLAWLLTALGGGEALDTVFGDPLRAQLLGLLLLTLPVVMYLALWEGAGVGATPGKLLLGLRVAGTGGAPLSLERAVLRSGLKVLPWEISHTVLWRLPGWPASVETLPPGAVAGFSLAWIVACVWLLGLLFDAEGRTGYDRLAGSRVVRNAGSGAPVRAWIRTAAGKRLRRKGQPAFLRGRRPLSPPNGRSPSAGDGSTLAAADGSSLSEGRGTGLSEERGRGLARWGGSSLAASAWIHAGGKVEP